MAFMDSFQLRLDNDICALRFIHQYGWMRPQELGHLMWPNMARDGFAHTCRAAQSWLKRGLILSRALPEGAGRAFVLAAGGVQMLKDAGFEASSGKDIGKMNASSWTPPVTWKHDLLATGVLVRYQSHDWDVFPEATIRRKGEWLGKIPDGLMVLDEQVVWLEVEQARKTGKFIRDLGAALAAAAAGQMAEVCGHRPTGAAVAYVVDAQDERSYQLDHKLRVTTAIQKESRQDTLISWIACDTKRSGVANITISNELVPADESTRILKVLDACQWRERDGALRSNYGARQAAIVVSDGGGYTYAVDDQQTFWAENLTAAKRGAASQIAAMPGQR